jgi:hypothetical protein
MSYTISLLATMGWVWTGLFFGWVALLWLSRRRRNHESSAAVPDA